MLVALPLQKRERKGKERERECVCVCDGWLRVSHLNAGQNKTRTDAKWGKRDAKAQQRHYSPAAHGAACGFYICRNYLLTV